MRYNVSIVKYINTLPFIYGINNSEIKDNDGVKKIFLLGEGSKISL